MSVNRASEVWKEIKPFAIRDMNRMLDNKAGDSGDDLYAIILYDESAQKIKYYSMSAVGLAAALAAASSGDIVWVPAGTISDIGNNYLNWGFDSGFEDFVEYQEVTLGGGDPGTTEHVDDFGNDENGCIYVKIFPTPGSPSQRRNGIKKIFSGLTVNTGDTVSAWFYKESQTLAGSEDQRCLSFIEIHWVGGGTTSVFYDHSIGAWTELILEIGAGDDGKVIDYLEVYGECNSQSIANWYIDDVSIISSVDVSITVKTGVELVGLGKNSILSGSITNNGILTNIQIVGTISGSGISRMVPNPTAELFSNQIKSLVATGTAPFSVESTTLVTNLNADMVDGIHASEFADASHTHTESEITDLDHNAAKIDDIVVDLTGISDSDALVYDAYTNSIVPGEGGGSTAVSDLTDVDLTDLVDGDVLVYDGVSGDWLPETPASGITVEEIDGTPSVSGVNTINITNGTLTDDGGGVITIDFGSAATDGSAIHDNEANEISAITEKTTPIGADLILVEDSEDGYSKKMVQIENLPSSGGSSGNYDPDTEPISPSIYDDEFSSTSLDGKWTALGGVSSGEINFLETGAVDKYDLTTFPGTILIQSDNVPAGIVSAGIRQDFSPGDGPWSIIAKCFINGHETFSSQYIVLGVGDDNTPTQFITNMQGHSSSGANAAYSIFRRKQGGTETDIYLQSRSYFPTYGHGMYLSLVRDNTANKNIHGYISFDGKAWIHLGSTTINWTISKLFLGLFGTSTVRSIAGYEWVRFFSSATLKCGR